jgi:hypothetical protein
MNEFGATTCGLTGLLALCAWKETFLVYFAHSWAAFERMRVAF